MEKAQNNLPLAFPIFSNKAQTQHYLKCYKVIKLRTENLQYRLYNKSQKSNVHVARVTCKTTMNTSTTGGSVMTWHSWLSTRSPISERERETWGVCVCMHMHEYMWKEPYWADNGVFDPRGPKRTQAGEQGQTNGNGSCIKARLFLMLFIFN